ncbi:hypothetical protein [Pectobacterium parmentieri]|uniref:hypothetical protein n=1 Tax=Pectobacterium parmentieri TaxID=1905730 RepID=UPI001C7CA0B7|nr:hypothetical protein [Pectobacterium parmentieri]
MTYVFFKHSTERISIDQQKGVSSVGSVGSRASKPRQCWIYMNQHSPYYVGSAVIVVGSRIQPENYRIIAVLVQIARLLVQCWFKKENISLIKQRI